MALNYRPSVSDARRTGKPLYRSILVHYPTRMMLALIVSMVVVTGALYVPGSQDLPQVGWFITPYDAIELSDIRPETADETPQQQDEAAPPASVQPPAADEAEAVVDDGAANGVAVTDDEATSEEGSDEPPLVPMAALHGTDDQMPEVLGGLGALYLNIQYPEQARREGIQGRLILEFTVDTDGYTHNIHVARSLHALCDSAAVAALQRTRFAPGRINGKPVPVRMYLPIRFRLIDSTGRDVPVEAQANAGDTSGPQVPF